MVGVINYCAPDYSHSHIVRVGRPHRLNCRLNKQQPLLVGSSWPSDWSEWCSFHGFINGWDENLSLAAATARFSNDPGSPKCTCVDLPSARMFLVRAPTESPAESPRSFPTESPKCARHYVFFIFVILSCRIVQIGKFINWVCLLTEGGVIQT